MTRKKVLFIARWYPEKNDSMFGLFVQKHAQAVQLFHDVTVLYVIADKTIAPGKNLITTDNFEGIQEIKIYFGKHRNEFFNALRYLQYYFKGISIVRSSGTDPDLVHVHILSRTALPAIWLKFTRGIPYIITEHWSRYLPVNISKKAYTGFLRKTFTKFAVSYASAVTTVTQNLADAMQSLGLKNTYYITPNVADTNLFRVSENNNNGTIKKLIHVSCFDEPAKNIKGIINVIKKLSVKRNDFIIDIIGTGPDFTEVHDHAEQTGLTGKIIFFHGLLEGEKLAGKMRDADLMVMFSNYENLPCTIVESICCGVPVISSDVGGIKEFLLPEFGNLVKARDEEDLELAICNFFENPQKFNKMNAANYGLEKFSLASSGKLFDEIYRKIANKQ